ncbi:hypothetical protein LIL_10906 [Leptospira interrogans serovar Linhai str. 56609]|nr:hypothetical protein LIL_10906 [Leptospira interrogans serovar Linhai str. 56609]EKO22879.1 hypothetical protein LEP1GSC104_1298 [Leptospira interrogans str. UI 12621]EMJ51804.1 hypothetical protein LEP1GSC111_0867 [Leptospira interrogans str. UT126]EMN71096.1 hypothetical protein LEP1GSC100_2025 [Leptospira interrogans serovar Bataviae str. UI 08561]
MNINYDMSIKLSESPVKLVSGNESERELNRIKDFVNKIYDSAGYSKTPWRGFNYDEWSTWFYYEQDGEILAVMRIVEKKPWNLIPLELALIVDEEKKYPYRRYAVIEEKVADWNSVAFVSTHEGWRAAKKTFRAVAKFCIDQDYSIVYGMYPLALKSIGLFYKKSGAVDSHRYFDRVFYPGFSLKGKPCILNVIELEKETLQKIASKAS